MLKPDDFHHMLIKIIDYSEGFVRTFAAVFVGPKKTFAGVLNSCKAGNILSGAFLFINLAIAKLISVALSSASVSLYEWSFDIFSHIIGTMLLLLLLKVFFWKVRTTKLFTILCLTSIVFIPYTIIMIPLKSVLGTSFLRFWTSALSGHYQTVSELFAPLLPSWYKTIPLSFLLVTVLIWWVLLLSAGCGQASALPWPKRIFRLCLSITGYIVVFVVVVTVCFYYISYSALSGYVDYDKMRASFKNQEYPEAFFLSSSVTRNKYMLPVFKYHAYLINGISGIKMFWKADPIFKDAILDINDVLEHRAPIGKYRDAELIMAKEIKARLLSMEDPMRGALYNAALAIEEADKQYKSPLYSEAKTQSISLILLTRDIPIDFFP